VADQADPVAILELERQAVERTHHHQPLFIGADLAAGCYLE
jgi:hypothetical protein